MLNAIKNLFFAILIIAPTQSFSSAPLTESTEPIEDPNATVVLDEEDPNRTITPLDETLVPGGPDETLVAKGQE